MSKRNAVIEGTSSVIVPVFVSMLTTVAAFASLLTLPGAYHQLARGIAKEITKAFIHSFREQAESLFNNYIDTPICSSILLINSSSGSNSSLVEESLSFVLFT